MSDGKKRFGGFDVPDWMPTISPEPISQWWHSLHVSKATLAKDAIAGIPGAVGSVPDGMASGVLVGVSPIYGLYASIMGPIVGGLLSSSALMVVTTTSAAALAAGSTLENIAPAKREGSLFLLVILAGLLMLLAGVFRMGRYVRFVSQPVMLGFLSGVAINVVCSQLSDLTGIRGGTGQPIARAWYVVTNIGSIEIKTVLLGAMAMVCLVAFATTRFRQFGALLAIAIPTVINLVGNLNSAKVTDLGAIPRGVPLPHLPHLSYLTPNIIVSAFAISVIVLVQGVGVGETVRTPGRQRPDVNRDFIAEGAANMVSGLFRGLPVGGSVSQSALNAAAGAKTRWAAIFSGVWLLIVVVLLSKVIGEVVVASLAGLLIVAAVQSLRPKEIQAAWSVGRSAWISFGVTFLATLAFPIAEAVGLGVIVSLLMQLNQEALDLKLVALTVVDGVLFEGAPPSRLPSNETTILDVYGSLFYAGSRTLQSRLPKPDGAVNPVVVLRMRGRGLPPTTFYFVISAYANALAERGGKLFLSGVDPKLHERFNSINESEVLGNYKIVEARDAMGASTLEAYDLGNAWILQRRADSTD
jgi:SulP family sulfate permease